MEILGIGLPELIFILIVALIVMGPRDMEKAGKTVSRWLRDIIMSPNWRAVKNVSKEIQSMPTRWMREINMEEQLNQIGKDDYDPIRSVKQKYPAPENSVSIAARQELTAPPIAEIQADESDSEKNA